MKEEEEAFWKWGRVFPIGATRKVGNERIRRWRYRCYACKKRSVFSYVSAAKASDALEFHYRTFIGPLHATQAEKDAAVAAHDRRRGLYRSEGNRE